MSSSDCTDYISRSALNCMPHPNRVVMSLARSICEMATDVSCLRQVIDIQYIHLSITSVNHKKIIQFIIVTPFILMQSIHAECTFNLRIPTKRPTDVLIWVHVNTSLTWKISSFRACGLSFICLQKLPSQCHMYRRLSTQYVQL